MRLVQTRNKRLVFGILFSALIVGIMLTIGQVPRGQPTGDHSREGDQGGNPDGWCKPHLGRVPGVIIPLSARPSRPRCIRISR